jgi:alanine racemase
MISVPSPLRLRLSSEALVANWRWLARQSGAAACGAALKADGYGLGARAVMRHLAAAGCRDFFVATWAEAAALMPLPTDVSLSVLHGVGEDDMVAARLLPARPVLNSVEQVQRWRDRGEGQPCDVMVDTGMNRLGISITDVAAGLLDGLEIDVLMSHLACADEDHPLNAVQQTAFAGLAGRTAARRLSLANSAGIVLGKDYAFDLTRPGLALYGGVPRPEVAGILRPVVHPQAQILQRRRVAAGAGVGYNATWIARADTEVAILNLGYADGYWRGFSGRGAARVDGVGLPVLGRVSMDLTAIDVGGAPDLGEGDWIDIDYDLPTASIASGMSQYELLTGLGHRFDRVWR